MERALQGLARRRINEESKRRGAGESELREEELKEEEMETVL